MIWLKNAFFVENFSFSQIECSVLPCSFFNSVENKIVFK